MAILGLCDLREASDTTFPLPQPVAGVAGVFCEVPMCMATPMTTQQLVWHLALGFLVLAALQSNNRAPMWKGEGQRVTLHGAQQEPQKGAGLNRKKL